MVVVVTKSSILQKIGRVAVKKYKAKSVPTFKLPLKGVIMRTIVQRGCTMKVVLHHYSALM